MKGKDQRTSRKEKPTQKRVRVWHTLRWRLTLFVFCVMMLSGILTAVVYLLLHVLFASNPVLLAITINPYILVAVLLGASAVIGTVLANNFGVYYLKPLKRLVKATEEVKKGNFKVQVENDAGAQSEMSQLTSSFNEMVRELDGIELLRNDFINNFSHEFKTPIVSIRGFARELQMGDLTREQREEYTRIIVEESDRLAKLSTTVLELSRLENQQIVTGQTNFELDEQIRRCILLLEPQWTEKELEIIPELEPLTIYSAEDITAQIWKNLIGNAVKFTPNGGTVCVSMTSDAEWVYVTIADTGIGMSEETKAHMFEKFYQGDPSHHRTGYGIGLSVVDRAVKLCGGSIVVESEEGRGSRFTVTLPKRTMVQAEAMET